MIQWHDGGRKIPGSSDKDMVDDDDDDDENDGVDTYADLDWKQHGNTVISSRSISWTSL